MGREREARLVYSTGGDTAAGPSGGAPAKTPAPARAAGGKGVRIAVERRPGGRLVTAVRGLQGSAEALLEMARDLKSACGAGGAVREGAIELQGDQAEGARRALEARGIKARISG